MSLTFVAIFHVLLLHFLFHHCICFQYYCSNSKYIPICLQYLGPGKMPLSHQPLIKWILYIFIRLNMAEICRFEKMNIHVIVYGWPIDDTSQSSNDEPVQFVVKFCQQMALLSCIFCFLTTSFTFHNQITFNVVELLFKKTRNYNFYNNFSKIH